MSATTLLLESLDSSRRLMLDSVRDFSAAELAQRPSPRLRSCAQVFGSAAVADREALRSLGVEVLPSVPDGFEARFARWGTGEDCEIRYQASLPEIFSIHRLALARAAGSLPPGGFDERLEAEGYFDEDGALRFDTVGEMLAAASAYTHFLVGEVTIIRLYLGKEALRDPFDGLWEESGRASRPPRCVAIVTAGPEAFLVVLGGRRTPLILWRLGHGTLLREAIAHRCEWAPGRETRRLGASLGG